MPSTINASSSSTTGIITTADSSGELLLQTNGTSALSLIAGRVVTPTFTGAKEVSVAVAASNIDLSLGNYFTRTISGTTTFTVSNVASSGTVSSFILQLTNGGSATVNWFSGVEWAGGTAPTLTASGVDVLGFYTLDGGTNWYSFVLGKAMA